MTTPGAPLAGRRIIGIDLARFAAIVGMMAAHLLVPLAADPNAPPVDQLLGQMARITVSSTAATTFAVLGGVSLVLLSRSMRRTGALRMLSSLLLRGLLISLVGACLEPLHAPLSVVLTYYGVALILSASALLLPSWAIGSIAAVLWLSSGIINAWLRVGFTPSNGQSWIGSLGDITADLLFTGPYAVLTWTGYMLVGILVAQLLLGARDRDALRRICLRLAIVGSTVYLLFTIGGRIAVAQPSWFGLPTSGDRILYSGSGAPLGSEPWMLLLPITHSGNPADMVRTVAGACFAIGLLVLLFDAREPRGGVVLDTIRAAGAAPLTIYTVHVVVTAGLHHAATYAVASGAAAAPPWYDRGIGILLLQLGLVLAIGAVLAMTRRRGPLEAALAWATARVRSPGPPI